MTTLQSSRAAADRGMAMALGRAESVTPGWSNHAYAFLIDYARKHGRFISEDVSRASHADLEFIQPPSPKAWGSVYRRAAMDGVIVMDGVGRSSLRHASICPMWRLA